MGLSHNSNNNNNNISNPNNQACAACKYRRRKCAPNCILAPYFPHDRQRQFLNAHKLFGVRNITRTIENLDPRYQDAAMRSIIYQSDMRAADPVGGCFALIQQLWAQIQYCTAELDLVLQHLATFRRRHHHEPVDVNSDHLNLCNPNNNIIALSPSSLPPGHYQDPCLVVPEHHHYHHNNDAHVPNLQEEDDANSWTLQDSMSSSLHNLKNGVVLDDQCGYVGDELYNDQKSLSCMLDIHCDDKRNNDIGFEPEELLKHSSDEAMLFKIENGVEKYEEVNCIQQVQDHDLKGAATFFTLTNCTSS